MFAFWFLNNSFNIFSAQKMKLSFKDFFSKRDTKCAVSCLMKNFIFCAVFHTAIPTQKFLPSSLVGSVSYLRFQNYLAPSSSKFQNGGKDTCNSCKAWSKPLPKDVFRPDYNTGTLYSFRTREI